MSESPAESETELTASAPQSGIEGQQDSGPGADEGQGDEVDPVQTGAPATGPQAPVPPGGASDAEHDDE